MSRLLGFGVLLAPGIAGVACARAELRPIAAVITGACAIVVWLLVREEQ